MNTAVNFQYQIVLVKKIQHIQIKLRINSYNQWCQLMRQICDCSTTANENREQNFFKNLSCMREHKVYKHLASTDLLVIVRNCSYDIRRYSEQLSRNCSREANSIDLR